MPASGGTARISSTPAASRSVRSPSPDRGSPAAARSATICNSGAAASRAWRATNGPAKAEYLPLECGPGAVLSNGSTFVIQADKHRYHLMKYGVNYRLGGSQGRLPMTNWTGLYVGIVGGTAVSEVRATDPRG